MSNKVNELKLDLEELKGMLSAATRPNVQDFIAGHISQVKTEL